MVGGHRQGSPALESPSEGDHSGDGGPRVPSGAEGSGAVLGPQNPHHRVPAYTESTLPSAQSPPAGAAGGAEPVVRQGRSHAASLAEGEHPQSHQQPRRSET